MNILTKALLPSVIEMPHNAVSDPIYQTVSYSFENIDDVDELLGGMRKGYSYTRGGNPNFDALAQFIATLEGGDKAVVTSSGTSSILSAILALRPKPCTIYLAQEIYGGTVGISRRILEPMGYHLKWIQTHNMELLADEITDKGSLLIIESLSNPLGRVCPLNQVIDIAHKKNSAVIVDNTFATPYHVNPLEYGADLVVHSATKFIGGHSDLILGLVVGKKELIKDVQEIIDVGGFTPDPFAAWLALRGARTLPLRMERSCHNALIVADALESQKKIKKVYYPGLSSHPDHDVAKQLLKRGFGSIVSFSLEGGYDAVKSFISHLKLIRFVPSLGDVATTLSHPGVASHRELSPTERLTVNIDDSTVRLSVGIEFSHDILQDINQALLFPE